MLVWLASYPRSGSKLIRMVLRRCFDLPSYDVYGGGNGGASPLTGLLGTLPMPEPASDFLARARREAGLFLVRTHEFAEDGDRAIYIVRDGRAALCSYQKFLRDFNGVEKSLPELITGECWPARWQDHVERWLARGPGRTLVLKYEDLTSAEPPLAAISAFLGVAVKRGFDLSFEDIRVLNPRHFPVGHNGVGVERIERDHSAIFWQHCGTAMRRLGYAGE